MVFSVNSYCVFRMVLLCLYGSGFEKCKYKRGITAGKYIGNYSYSNGNVFFVNFQLPILSNVLPQSVVQEYSNLMEEAGYGIEFIPTLICLILAPVAEEFMFRGILFYYLIQICKERLGKRSAFWLANIIQAIMFGIFHMNPIQGGYAFIIGLVLGYLVHQYRSLAPAIMVHVINNFLSAFVWGLLEEALPDGNGVYAIGVGLSLCIVVLGMMLSIVNSDNI